MNNLDNLDKALDIHREEFEKKGKGRFIIEHITGTPDTDRTQLIGSFMPVEETRRAFKEERMRFEKGVLYKLVEAANANPENTYVLRLDQMEALSAKVWVQLNQYLLTGELHVPETGDKLNLPSNLKIITSVTTGLRDSAFYDRFLRKQLAKTDANGIFKYVIDQFHGPIGLGASEKLTSILALTESKDNKLSLGQALVLISYIKGRADDERLNLSTLDGLRRLNKIIDEEKMMFLANMAEFKDSSIAHDLELTFDVATGRLLANGIELPIYFIRMGLG